MEHGKIIILYFAMLVVTYLQIVNNVNGVLQACILLNSFSEI